MLTLWADKQRTCDGISRRNFLRAGALGLGGLTLADVLRARAQAAGKPKPRAVIMVCLPGGPSHIDTFDPKPDAPEDYRGEFKPIRSSVSGFDVSEMLPLTAGIADKLALVRTVQFKEPMQHGLHEVYTGYTLADSRPSFGSAICRAVGGGDRRLPRYVSLDYNAGGFRLSKIVEIADPNNPGQKLKVAVAEIQLNTTQAFAGDNYIVRATTIDPGRQNPMDPNSPLRPFNADTHSQGAGNVAADDVKQSALLTAWWRVYYEEDFMFRNGASILQTVNAGDTLINISAKEFKVGDIIHIVDTKNTAGEVRKVIAVDQANNTITLNSPLAWLKP